MQGRHSRTQKAKCEREEGSNHSINCACVVMTTIMLIGAVVVVLSYCQLFLSFSCCTILDGKMGQNTKIRELNDDIPLAK